MGPLCSPRASRTSADRSTHDREPRNDGAVSLGGATRNLGSASHGVDVLPAEVFPGRSFDLRVHM